LSGAFGVLVDFVATLSYHNSFERHTTFSSYQFILITIFYLSKNNHHKKFIKQIMFSHIICCLSYIILSNKIMIKLFNSMDKTSINYKYNGDS
jgi:hypothetical protein